MVWTGILIKEGLEDDSLLDLVNIVGTKKGARETDCKINIFQKIEIDDKKKDEFVQKAIKKIKQGFYIYLLKDKVIYVIFKDRMFKFSKNYPELETARNYGLSIGIPENEMQFEKIITNGFDNLMAKEKNERDKSKAHKKTKK